MGPWWEIAAGAATVVGLAAAAYRGFKAGAAGWLKGVLKKELVQVEKIPPLERAQRDLARRHEALESRVENQRSETRGCFERIEGSLSRMEEGLGELKDDVTELKTDMGWVKRSVNGRHP